jgi:hypothetical protein
MADDTARQSDRRKSGRYPIQRGVRYEMLDVKSVLCESGRTVDMSGHGVLFTTEHPLIAGDRAFGELASPVGQVVSAEAANSGAGGACGGAKGGAGYRQIRIHDAGTSQPHSGMARFVRCGRIQPQAGLTSIRIRLIAGQQCSRVRAGLCAPKSEHTAPITP